MSTEELDWDDAPVLVELMGKLANAYPDFTLTTHVSDSGYRYTMISYADEDGEFESGAPGEFVSMVSNLSEDD